jgi:hypothetical protein
MKRSMMMVGSGSASLGSHLGGVKALNASQSLLRPLRRLPHPIFQFQISTFQRAMLKCQCKGLFKLRKYKLALESTELIDNAHST